jgi:hypothetical protein
LELLLPVPCPLAIRFALLRSCSSVTASGQRPRHRPYLAARLRGHSPRSRPNGKVFLQHRRPHLQADRNAIRARQPLAVLYGIPLGNLQWRHAISRRRGERLLVHHDCPLTAEHAETFTHIVSLGKASAPYRSTAVSPEPERRRPAATLMSMARLCCGSDSHLSLFLPESC